MTDEAQELKRVREGDILEGDLWPEPITVVAVKEIRDLVEVESPGISSHAYLNFLKRAEDGMI